MTRTTAKELYELAYKAGLSIQHDCGGYRVVAKQGRPCNSYVFPDTGICPTATKRECLIFLKGWIAGRVDFAPMRPPQLQEAIDGMFNDIREMARAANAPVTDEEILEYVTAIATLTYDFGIKHEIQL